MKDFSVFKVSLGEQTCLFEKNTMLAFHSIKVMLHQMSNMGRIISDIQTSQFP